MSNPRASVAKLRKLKQIRRNDLEKNLLDVQLKGQDHYVFIKDNGKAQVVYEEGEKTEKMFIRDFEDKYINEYEKTLQ